MAATTTEYVTLPGDRWDLISWKAYGSIGDIIMPDGTTQNAIGVLIRANPDIIVSDVLTEGQLLQIPIIPSSNVQTAASLLPPWKQ